MPLEPEWVTHFTVHATRQIHNLALTGFMGTGKSSVGHAVASLLHFQFVDTDELIESKAGKRISAIFADDGETVFRRLEHEVVAELKDHRRSIIATGGGLIVNPENLASLKTHALVVCLWASPETIWERVHHQSHRPLLNTPNPMEQIRRLLTEREPSYRDADVLVNTEMRSVKEVAQHVAHQFRVAQSSSIQGESKDPKTSS